MRFSRVEIIFCLFPAKSNLVNALIPFIGLVSGVSVRYRAESRTPPVVFLRGD